MACLLLNNLRAKMTTGTKDKSLGQQLQKAWRGFQRGLRGWLSAGDRLSFEKSGAILKGDSADIRALRGLDLQIGAMTRSFNGASRVPDKVVEKIELHVQDVAENLARVAAVKKEFTDDIGNLMKGVLEETHPVHALEYVSSYPSNAGNSIEQRLAKVSLG